MGVSFASPWWWLLLPALLALAWYLRHPWLAAARESGRVAWRQERRRLVTRWVVLVLLVAVLAGTHLVMTVQDQAVILAVDASASVGPRLAAAEAWVREALAAKSRSDRAGVISFGATALVEEPLSERPGFRRVQTDPGVAATAVGKALRLAGALLPAESRRRVVLLTDGRDTAGDALVAARQLQAEGIRVDVVPAGGAGQVDVSLVGLEVPARARIGERTTLEVTVRADRSGRGTLFVERDGELITSLDVDLRPGENRFTFGITVGPAGLHRYRVYFEAADPGQDALAANNSLGAIQEVMGPPRVLVVTQVPREAAALTEALSSTGGVNVEVAGPDAIPQEAASLAAYQAVFLVNVPAYALGEDSMAQLESFVRDGGGGLVMVGGPDSFGPGGYAGTPVERALPVEMQVSGKGEMPSLGLVLVIDKSGSMAEYAGGADKIGLAKEAAARSVGLLTDRDQVGVLAFDSQPWWVVPLAPATDRKAIQDQIGRLNADGGTEIYPALAGAYAALRDAPVQVKHIILLTDGVSASGGPYVELVEAMRDAGITLSTVAVGQGADAAMLQALAEMGRGRYYFTADAGEIPSIFTKETIMATRSYAVNEEFYPHVAAGGDLLRGITEVPPLQGYITTTSKGRAETVLISHRGDPVLAAWQYGLGRAVAWTPDVAGRWSAPWINSQVFSRLWGNVLSWILPAVEANPVEVKAEAVGGPDNLPAVRLEVSDPGHWDEVRELEAVVTAPDGSSQRVPLNPAGPGRYTAELPGAAGGAYAVGVTTREGDELLARTGVVVPYPAEYRESRVDMAALQALAQAGGGEVLTDPAQAFAPNLPPVRASRDLASRLLAVAALLWVVDIAGRRLVLGREEREWLAQVLARAWGWVTRRKVGQAPAPSPVWAGQAKAAVEQVRARVQGKEVADRSGAAGGDTRWKEIVGTSAKGAGERKTAGRPTPASPDTRPAPGVSHPASKTGDSTAAALLAAKRRRAR